MSNSYQAQRNALQGLVAKEKAVGETAFSVVYNCWFITFVQTVDARGIQVF